MLLVMTIAIFGIACNSGSSEQQGPEYTSRYICPMHCEGSGSDKPGKCPNCEMDYVLNENYQGDSTENTEDHNHGDHDHDHSH